MLPSCFTLLLPTPLCFTYCYMLIRTLRVATYSFLCASPNYYLLLLLCFALQLLVLSFTFHLTTYLLPLSCFTLLLHVPSFMFHPTITSSFLCALPYDYLFFPLSSTLPPTYSFAFHDVVFVMDANAMKFNHLNVHP